MGRPRPDNLEFTAVEVMVELDISPPGLANHRH